jgi:uncharacterized protein YdeI (YjbR/CyaY-like superfamily)
MNKSIQPVYFKTTGDFRKWLNRNYDKAAELLVGFYKVKSNQQSITWSESVDQALCFGWIDGVRRSIDGERYCIRFTPRKATSTWSAININKVKDLSARGLMHPAGISAFEKRKENKSRIYSYEKETVTLPDKLENIFKSNKKAWQFFSKMPASYKRPAIHWVMSAKREDTRQKRFNELVTDSEKEKKIKILSY